MTSAIYPSGSLTHRPGGGGGGGTGSSRAFATGYPGKATPRASMPFHAALQPLGEGVVPAPLAAVGAGGGGGGGGKGVPALNLTKVGSAAGGGFGGGGVPHTAPLQPLGGLTPVPPPVPRGSETDRTGYHGKPRAGMGMSGGGGAGTLRPRRPGADAQNGLTPLGAPSSAGASALASVASGANSDRSGGSGNNGLIAPGVGPLPHFPPARSGGMVALPSLSSPLAPPLSDPVHMTVAASSSVGGRRDSSGSLAAGGGSSGSGGMTPLQLSDPLLAILEKQPVRLMAAGNQNPQPLSAGGGESPNGEVGYTPGGGVVANDRYATVNIHSAASTLRQDVKTDQQVLHGLMFGKGPLGGGMLGGKEDPLLAAARAKAAAQAAAEAQETRDESLPTSPRNLRKSSTDTRPSDAVGGGVESSAGAAAGAGAGAGATAVKSLGHKPKRASGSKSKSRSKSREHSKGGASGGGATEWLREMDDAKKTGTYRKSLPEHTHALVTFSATLQALSTGLFAKDAHARIQILKFHKTRATISDAMWKQITGTDGSAVSTTTVQAKAYGEKITASGDDLYARVWESEVFVPDTHWNSGKPLQPNFKPCVLAASTLCEYEPLRPLLVRVWNARDAAHPEFWAEARTTWAQLSGALPTAQSGGAATACKDAKDEKGIAAGAAVAPAATASTSAKGGVRLALTSNEHKAMGDLVLSGWSQIAQRSVGAVFGKKKRTTDAHVQARLRFSGHDVTSRGWSKDSPYVQVYLLIKPGDEEVLPQLAAGAKAEDKLPTATRATKKGVEESWALVYTSAVCAQNDTPEWSAFHLPLAHLCCLSIIRAVRVVVRHAAAANGQPTLTGGSAGSGVVGSDPIIGEATTSVKKLLGDVGGDDDEGEGKAAAPTASDKADAKAAVGDKKTPSKPAAPQAAAPAAGPPVLILVNEQEKVKRPKEYTPNGTLQVVECMLFYDGERAKNLPPPPATGQVTPSAPTGPPPSNSRAKSKAAAAVAAAKQAPSADGDASAEVSVSVKPSVLTQSKSDHSAGSLAEPSRLDSRRS